MSWNATGPQGEQGPAGPAGADGADGADGEFGCENELRILAAVPGFELSEGCSAPGVSVSVGVSVDVDHDGDGVLDTVVNCDGVADATVSDVGLVSVTVTNSGPGATVVDEVFADPPVTDVHRWVEEGFVGLRDVPEGGQVTLTRRFSALEEWPPAFGVSGEAEFWVQVSTTFEVVSGTGTVGWASTQIDGCGASITSDAFSADSLRSNSGNDYVYWTVSFSDPSGNLPSTMGARACPPGSTNLDTPGCTGATMSRNGTSFSASYTGLFIFGRPIALGEWIPFAFWPVGQAAEQVHTGRDRLLVVN